MSLFWYVPFELNGFDLGQILKAWIDFVTFSLNLGQIFEALLNSKIPIGLLIFKLACVTSKTDTNDTTEIRLKYEEKILAILMDEEQIKLLHPLKVSYS